MSIYYDLSNCLRSRRSIRFCLQKDTYRLKCQTESLITSLELGQYGLSQQKIPIKRNWYPVGSGIITLSDINVLRIVLIRNCLRVKNFLRLYRLGCLIEPSVKSSLTGFIFLYTIKETVRGDFLKQLLLSHVIAQTLYILICTIKSYLLQASLIFSIQLDFDFKVIVQNYLRTKNLIRFESELQKLSYFINCIIKNKQLNIQMHIIIAGLCLNKNVDDNYMNVCVVSSCTLDTKETCYLPNYFSSEYLVETKIGWFRPETLPQFKRLHLITKNFFRKRGVPIIIKIRKRYNNYISLSYIDISLRGLTRRATTFIRHLNRPLKTRPINWRTLHKTLYKFRSRIDARSKYRGFKWNKDCVVRITSANTIAIRNILIFIIYKMRMLNLIYSRNVTKYKMTTELPWCVYKYKNLRDIARYSLHTLLCQGGKILPRLITTSRHGFIAYTSNKHAPKRSRKKAVVHRKAARIVRWARQYKFIPYIKKHVKWPKRPLKRVTVRRRRKPK